MFILVGCKEQSNEPISATPYEKWLSYNIHNYTIEQIRTCECINGGIKMKVTVQSDTVAVVMKLSDSTFIPYPSLKQYLSIDSLFGIIQYAKVDSLVYTYNEQYGYPAKLDINPQQHPVDGGALYETSNLQPKK